MLLSGSTAPPLKSALRFAMSFFLPDLSYMLNISTFDEDNLNFFIRVIKNSMHSRKERRNDFIDLLKDSIQDIEDEQKKKKILAENDITDYVIANALLLFFVGNDTSSGAMAFSIALFSQEPRCARKTLSRNSGMATLENGNFGFSTFWGISYPRHLEQCV